MMRTLIITLFLFHSAFAFAQWRMAVGYNYMVATSWDRAIQTYNFARPELDDPQPLLIHGIEIAADRYGKSDKLLKHGPAFSYRYFRSAAHNDNFDATIHAHLITLGYAFRGGYLLKEKPLFCEVAFAVVLGGVFRSVNGEALRDDGRRIWAPGIGGELRPRIGYEFTTLKGFVLSPYFQTTYCPFYYSPRVEALLNQTIGLTGPKYTGILSMEVGVVFSRATK